MALTSTISGGISARQTVVNDAGTASYPAAFSQSISLADGTIAGKADKLFTDTRTVALSSSEDIDLSGSLLDGFGNSVVFVKIKGLYIFAHADNTNNVVVGAKGPTTGWVGFFAANTNSISLKPGYFFCLGGSGTGYSVTNTTDDIILVTNSGAGTGVTYDIAIVGTSA